MSAETPKLNDAETRCVRFLATWYPRQKPPRDRFSRDFLIENLGIKREHYDGLVERMISLGLVTPLGPADRPTAAFRIEPTVVELAGKLVAGSATPATRPGLSSRLRAWWFGG